MQANDSSSSNDDPGHRMLGAEEARLPPLPHELSYLMEPAIRYAQYQFEDQIQEFLETAAESDVEALATLAEKVRLSGDHGRVLLWLDAVDDIIEEIVDKRHPYVSSLTRQQEKSYLTLVNPELSKRAKVRAVRFLAEAKDNSSISKLRRELRNKLKVEANTIVHQSDVYSLFGFLDACDMPFE